MGAQCLHRGCQGLPGPRGYCEGHANARRIAAAKVRAVLDAPPKQFHESEFIYIVALDGYQAFKVGRSIDPLSRLQALKTPMPMDMSFVGVFCVASSAAYKLESAVHAVLKECDHHIRGEWFDAEPKDIIAVIRKCAEMTGIHIVTLEDAAAIVREHTASNGGDDDMLRFGEKVSAIWRHLTP